MFKMSKNNRRWWDFLFTMLEREIKSKYKLSVLGIFWMVVAPILQMMIIGFVFKFFTSLKTVDYLFYLFSGLIVWNFFSSSLIRSTPSIVSERFLLKKSVFPKEVIVISIVLFNLIQMLISLIIMIIVALFLGRNLIFMNLIFLPISILLIFFFVLGCCLISSSLNVRYRDVNFIMNFLVPVWFYITPVIYTPDVLPKEIFSWLYINPLTSLLSFFRLSIFGWNLNNINSTLIGFLVSLLTLLLGYFFFKRESLKFDDWI